jgi:hypothetical protein
MSHSLTMSPPPRQATLTWQRGSRYRKRVETSGAGPCHRRGRRSVSGCCSGRWWLESLRPTPWSIWLTALETSPPMLVETSDKFQIVISGLLCVGGTGIRYQDTPQTQLRTNGRRSYEHRSSTMTSPTMATKRLSTWAHAVGPSVERLTLTLRLRPWETQTWTTDRS